MWVPTQWRRVDDLGILGPASLSEGVPGSPWLLVEAVPSRGRPCPHELFLRDLYRVDLGSDEDVLRWCGRWGVPRLPLSLTGKSVVRHWMVDHTVEALVKGPGSEDDAPAPRIDPSEAAAAPPVEIPAGAVRRVLRDALRQAGERAGSDVDPSSAWRWRVPGGPPLRAVPAATARFAVGLYQALVGFFIALPRLATSENLRPLDAEALAGLWVPVGVPPETFDHPDALLDVLLTSIELLNELVKEAEPWAVEIFSGTGEPVVMRRSTVGDVVALELASYLHDREPARRCLFCGGWFHHQIGRARKGQQRLIGVKYCSEAHAHAAAQRAYRKRKAEVTRRRP